MKIQGQIRIGEAHSVAGASMKRAHGELWGAVVAFLFTVIGALIGAVAGIDEYEPSSRALGGMGLGLIMGLSLGFLIGRRLWAAIALWQGRRRYRARGTPDPMPVSVELTPDALIYVVADVTSIVAWPGVSDLFMARDWWVFVTQGGSYFVARRFFTAPQAERAFVAQALAAMPEAARARCRKADEWATETA